MSSTLDKEIIDKIKAGQKEEALDMLTKRHYLKNFRPKINSILWIGYDESDYNEVYLRAFDQFCLIVKPDFIYDNDEALVIYFQKLCENKAKEERDKKKKRKIKEISIEKFLYILDQEQQEFDDMIYVKYKLKLDIKEKWHKTSHENIFQAIQKLSERCKMFFILKYFAGFENQAIVDIFDKFYEKEITTENSAKATLYRCKESFVENLFSKNN
jgi:hypothetical protein